MSELTQLYDEIRVCQKCDLAKGRTNTVPGEGPENAEIMMIGEAPGFHEDREGRPFVGAAGKSLDELLAVIRLQLHRVEVEQLDAGIGSSRVVDVDNRYGGPIITRVMGHE